MTTTENNNIDSPTLISLYEIGFKLVPLSENHIPVIEWGSVYDNSNYWQEDEFTETLLYSKFKNVSSTVGKTHLKDSDNNDLFIQVLDVDSDHIYNILSNPIAQFNTILLIIVLKSQIHDMVKNLVDLYKHSSRSAIIIGHEIVEEGGS